MTAVPAHRSVNKPPVEVRRGSYPMREAVRSVLASMAIAALAACGGADNGATDGFAPGLNSGTRMKAMALADPSTWLTLPPVADPLLQNLAIPADAPTRGMWSGSKPWPLNAIHAIVLADGRLLTFGTPFNNAGAQDGRFYDVWNPALGFAAGAHVASVVADPVNSFCSTSTWLASGQLLVSGGNGGGGKSSGLFSTLTSTATPDGASLAAERWYATMLTLADGRSLILGGTVPYANPLTSQTPEIYEGGRWRSLLGASSTPIFGVRQLGAQAEANPWYYPRSWVAPDGSVFGITSNIMFRMRPDDNGGSGSITQIGTFKTPQVSNGTATPNVGFTSTAVMYEPGRILQVGGNGITDNNPNQASNQATVIDINGAAPVLTETAPMANRRHWANATVLPDGKVVVTGGTTIGWDPANAVRPAEIWNPQNGTWSTGASNVETRSYHSSGLLLPNGTVFTAGGGAPGAVNNLNAEVYYPPQLFTGVGGSAQLAPRPLLQAISSLKGAYGEGLGLQMTDGAALSQVSLVALGSVTHSFNNTQRRIPLAFTQAGNIATATLPASPNVAPPGYYMVFAVNAAGVYSHGTIIALGNLPAPPAPTGSSTTLPSTAVACANEGGTCTIPVGQKATVYYGANGAYSVRTGLSGAVACDNATFNDPLPGTGKACRYNLETAPPPVPAVDAPPITTGATANYTLAAADGATYSWNFGDGSAVTAAAATPSVTHVFSAAGVYSVTLTVRWSNGTVSSRSFLQAVAGAITTVKPVASSATALEPRTNTSARLWVANPDADTVAVVDTANNMRVAEIAVGSSPRSVAIAPDGRVWVTNKGASTISIINPGSLSVAATVSLPRASQPHGLVFAPGGSAFVVLEATGQLLKLDPANGAMQATLGVGANARHVSATADGATVLVSRFITNPLPGEGTATVNTTAAGAEVLVVNAGAMALAKTVVLRHSDKVDNEVQGSGIPNYLAAAVVSPDGQSAWVPSKQDNIKRGTLRSTQALNFQNSVRAISSRIDMATLAEDYARRIDHDNSSLGSAAAFHPNGAYLFVALETSRQVAVVDAAGGRELAKVDVGRAPQAVAVSADGTRLFVQNFMDRSISVIDLGPLMTQGLLTLPTVATVGTVGTERLAANVLQGKRHFYDARDPRLARDSYMSCASCHSDAGHDGRTWDFTSFGEGLRNTPTLKGRAGTGQGFMHWSANFDEIQDFEGQIRNFAGGTGLMSDAQFNTGTRNTPLGERKAGLSADLDALAAYLASLNMFDDSPARNADGTLTAAAISGRAVFGAAGCDTCHGGVAFTISGDAGVLRNIGTIKPTSGQRLGAALAGIDVPTLRDAWNAAPYLHDGSAPSLGAAVQAHQGNAVAGADLNNLVAYLQQIGAQEAAAPGIAQPPANAVTCASENGTCTIPAGTAATVWYGANGVWAVKTGISGSIGCNNAVFGDPIFGPVKACRYLPAANGANQPPTVSLTAPANNTTIAQGGSITVTATAADADGAVTKVEFYDGANLFATVATVPYTTTWNDAATGAHSLTAKAYDNTGAVTTSAAIALTVTGGTASTPPASAVTCANENGTCTIPNGATATVWYGANTTWAVRTAVNGSIACNNAVFGDPIPGTVKTCRRTATSTATNQAPAVALTSPANNTSVPQDTAIALTASAADADGAVARVEFYDGTTLLGTAAAAPYAITWNGAATGAHTLSAKAYDNAGAVTTSATIVLTVTATVPAAPPASATTCANENGTCTVPNGTIATVWYGANAAWARKTGVTGSIACTNALFGDPIFGTVKTCRYQ